MEQTVQGHPDLKEYFCFYPPRPIEYESLKPSFHKYKILQKADVFKHRILKTNPGFTGGMS
jgi:hypothetical protein